VALRLRCGIRRAALRALVFGRIGDVIGRKYAFLLTVSIMGGATFVVACCQRTRRSHSRAGHPGVLRLLQASRSRRVCGAAIYVATRPGRKRGCYTSWIQTTATVGMFAALA